MGFLRKDTLPKPNLEAEKDNKIAELEQQLEAIKKAREAQKVDLKPSPEPPLPPKYENVAKEQHKIEYVPISHDELIQMQLEKLQQSVNEILERLK